MFHPLLLSYYNKDENVHRYAVRGGKEREKSVRDPYYGILIGIRPW